MTEETKQDWNPLDPETFKNPHKTYADLQQHCPVAYSDAWDGFWTLTRYDDIVSFTTSGFASTATKNLVPQSPRNGLPRKPLHIDPPEHAHFRRAMNPYFEEEHISRLEEDLRAIAGQFLTPLLEKGTADMMSEFANLLPMRAISLFLGTDEKDAQFLQRTSLRYVHALGSGKRELAYELSAKLDSFSLDLVKARQNNPLDPEQDIVSGLLLNGVNGEPVPVEVVAGFVRGLLVAADRGTCNGIGNSILHLAEDKKLQNYLRQHPERIPDALEEFLRLYAPSAATARTATKDVLIDGQQIHKGEVVAMVYLAANRDPNIFPEPDTFKLDRHPNRHLGFGHGVHKCAGQSLARLQLRVALEELLSQTIEFKLDGLVKRHISFPEYGLEELPIRFSS